MRITFKDAIAIIRPFGILQDEIPNLNEHDINLIKSRRIECVLISLKDVIYFQKSQLNSMLMFLQDISQQTKTAIGFCDYSAYKHKIILKNYGTIINFSLFESEKTAQLFFGRVSPKQLKEKVLIFNTNVQKRDFITKHLQDRGYECEICQNIKDFLKIKNNYKHSVGSWTTLSVIKKNIDTFSRGDTVIYKISDMIDSNFEQNFNIALHNSLMASGFKFFAFIVGATSITNILGANFLATLAKSSIEQGGVIGICGINKSLIPNGILTTLQEAHILLFSTLEDFLSQNDALYTFGKVYETKQTGITKTLIEHLPDIIQVSLNTLKCITNTDIQRGEVTLKEYNIYDDYISGSVAFYGDLNFKIMISLPLDIVLTACPFLDGADVLEDSFIELIYIIGTKIIDIFIKKNIKLNISMPKTFVLQSDLDRGSMGACVDLDINKQKGLLFITR